MAGTYGTVKPADIDIENDVTVYYHYRPSWSSDDVEFATYKKGDTSWLTKAVAEGENSEEITISGLFNLNLPMREFSKRGIYTIYITPKEIDCTIMDVGYLSSYPDVRGIVFSTEGLERFRGNNLLSGYRVEYLNNGTKTGEFKLLTSSNMASAKMDGGNIRYSFDMGGSLLFCTATPSLASTFKSSDLPFLGSAGEKVKLVNTKFNPIMIELEMVDNDADTLMTMLKGDQLIDKDNALVTVFNDNGEIFRQFEYGTLKDDYGQPLYEFKTERDNLDFNQTLDIIE